MEVKKLDWLATYTVASHTNTGKLSVPGHDNGAGDPFLAKWKIRNWKRD